MMADVHENRRAPAKLIFTYRIVGRGWSEASLSDGLTGITVTASYLSDALAEMTDAVLTLLRGASHASCRFAEEPGEYRWIFERQHDNLMVVIRRFDDTFASEPDEAGQLIFSVEGKLKRLAVQLSNQLGELLERHGADGYRDLWGYDFPMLGYEKLASLIREI
jgi:hypothetical protein